MPASGAWPKRPWSTASARPRFPRGRRRQGTPGDYTDAGAVRDRQVLIGARNSAITEARFIPPPPGDQLDAGFRQSVDWINNPPEDLPPVVHAALAHYQFETLHPFSDGNGRIGRLVIALQLMRQQVLGEPLLVVSPWFEARRDEYQDGLLRLSSRGPRHSKPTPGLEPGTPSLRVKCSTS